MHIHMCSGGCLCACLLASVATYGHITCPALHNRKLLLFVVVRLLSCCCCGCLLFFWFTSAATMATTKVLSIFVCHLSRPSTCTLSSALACHRHNYQKHLQTNTNENVLTLPKHICMCVCMYMCLCTCIQLFPYIYSVAVKNNVCNSVCTYSLTRVSIYAFVCVGVCLCSIGCVVGKS